MKYYFLKIITILFLGSPVLAQEYILEVRDKLTGKPISFVNFSFERLDNKGKSYSISNIKGTIENDIECKSRIYLSCIGYKTLVDTVIPGSGKVFYLSPMSFNLEEVIITGEIVPKRIDKSIYKIKVLDKIEIEQKAATNLSGLLTNELNINLTYEGVLGRSLNIKGLSREHIKILINGIPVIGRQNGIIDLDQLNLQNVERIEILEGPMSVVYGSNALGGVVNIITKDYQKEKFFTRLNTYYESIGTYNIDGTFVFRKNSNTFTIDASRNFFPGFKENPDSRSSLWKPKLQYNGGLNYSLNKNKIYLKLSADYFNEELRDMGILSSKYLFEAADDRHYFTKRIINNVNLLIHFNDKWKSSLTGGFSHYSKRKVTYFNDLVNLVKSLSLNPELHDTTKLNLFHSRINLNYNNKRNVELQTGYDINFETGVGKRIKGTKRIGDFAVFGTLIYSPATFIDIQPGVRVIYNTEYVAPAVYSLNTKITLQKLQIRTSYGKGFRTPSLKELYMEFVDMNHRVFGNESLKAELSNNYMLTVGYPVFYKTHSLLFETGIFYYKIKNKIDFIIDLNNPAQVWAKYFNIENGYYKTMGLDFTVNYKHHPGFNFKTGVVVSGISRLTNLNKLVYSGDFISTIKYGFINNQISVSAYYKYTDKRTFYSQMFNAEDNSGEIMESFISDYHNLDIIINSYFFKRRFQLSAGIKNLFNNINILSTGIVDVHGDSPESMLIGWGRNYFIKLSYMIIKY